MGISEEEGREKGKEKLKKNMFEIMFENSQNVRKDMNLYSQEAQQTPGKINSSKLLTT